MTASMAVSLWTLCCTLSADATGPVQSIGVSLPPGATPATMKIGQILARQIRQRCGAKVTLSGQASQTIKLSIRPGIGTEGFTVAGPDEHTVQITGNDELGLLYGIGKFLRSSRYDQRGFTPGPWRGTSVPRGPFRAIYAATHFNNFYEAAPVEEVRHYIEDLGLWGANTLIITFPTWDSKGFHDLRARRNIRQTQALLKAAKSIGLNVGLVQCPNQGFASAPQSIRAAKFPDDLHRRGNFGVNCCPSQPAGHDYLMKLYAQLFDEYKDPGLDVLLLWPYDEGGCGCPTCWPWGAKGFPKMSRDLVLLARSKYPALKSILSTWAYDAPPAGEWEGLTAFMAQDRSWLNYIMADSHTDFPRYPLEKGVPGGLPLVNFPEISMWARNPWGGYGANPLPDRFERLWKQTDGKVVGGMPYSEGIYEDMNKVVCFQFYWQPDRPADDTLKEYIAFEYSPDVVEDVMAAIHRLEETWPQAGPKSGEARELIEKAEARLTPQARTAWRWRILYLRTVIDTEMARRGGRIGGPILKQAFDELTRIYHAEQAHDMPVRPPVVAWHGLDGPDLPKGYAETVLASKPQVYWRMDDVEGKKVTDSSGNGNHGQAEGGLDLPDRETLSMMSAGKPANPACASNDGRIRAVVKDLPATYSIEMWFWNALPNNARPVTAYLFSRGKEGTNGPPGDHLGIGGTSCAAHQGRLIFYNGDALNQVVAGKTVIAPRTWNHVVMVRDGKKVTVYLNGRSEPEFTGEAEIGCPSDLRQVFFGGRSDNFANLNGKLDEVAVYNRALTTAEIARRMNAADGRASSKHQGYFDENKTESSTLRTVNSVLPVFVMRTTL